MYIKKDIKRKALLLKTAKRALSSVSKKLVFYDCVSRAATGTCAAFDARVLIDLEAVICLFDSANGAVACASAASNTCICDLISHGCDTS